MSGKKFTEGPWHVEWSKDDAGCPTFNVLKSDGDASDDGRMVDASYSIIEEAFPVLATDEDAANANLIAAAPSLYEALHTLLRHCRAHESSARLLGQSAWSIATVPDPLRRADMALAYARGEDFRDDD